MKKIWSIVLTLCMIFCMTGCSSGEKTEKIDTSKTQLYVFNYDGGFGSNWLASVKKDFEEKYADSSFEEGKKGVQIMIHNEKTKMVNMADRILDNKEEVYFTEAAYYFTLLYQEKALGDITQAVTADLSGFGDASGTTIESKLTEEQQDYFGVTETDGKKHYYGLPHYNTFFGLTYNVDLFEDNGYFYKKGADIETDAPDDCFVSPHSSQKRSAGPDGKEGTDDDGLPATYDEFFFLCDYIAAASQIPLVWSGADYMTYLNGFTSALAANGDGLTQTMLGYNFDENTPATTLGTIVNGNFVKDAAPTTVTGATGYETARSAGKYYALDFVHRMTEKSGSSNKYAHELAFNGGYSHLNAQSDFLWAGNDGGVTKPIAMLMDGNWWENEAEATFKIMSDAKGDDFKKENRNFSYMPMPHPTKEAYAEAVDKNNNADPDDDVRTTFWDTMYSMCFMKKNVAEWKIPLAQEFIMFCHSDRSLVDYTISTGTTKAFNYTVSEDDIKDLSPYSKSMLRARQAGDVAYPFSSHSVYVNNQSYFASNRSAMSRVGNTDYQYPAEAFYENNVSAADYFSGMYKYQSASWPAKA